MCFWIKLGDCRMPNSISDQKLSRQIAHLTRHLPPQEELRGQVGGSSFYRHVNDRSFIDAYRLAYSHIKGLQDRFELTSSQKSILSHAQEGLVTRVERAFDHLEQKPANLENFLRDRKKA
jgi:hypothetical protein